MRKPDFTATATLKEDCPCRREHREPLPYAPTGTADGGRLPQFAVAPNACRNLRPAPNASHHAEPERRPMDRLSCGTCKHFRDVGYQHWGECTAPAPRWAWGEYIETTRQVFRDGSAADLAPDCEAYKSPHAEPRLGGDSVNGVVRCQN